MRPLILSIALALAAGTVLAAERPSEETIEDLVKQYAFKVDSTLPAEGLEFEITRVDVPGLWEQLGVEVYDIGWVFNRTRFNGYIGYYREGKLNVLVPAPNLGGKGVLSGALSKGAFYFTYSWGSGIFRSHVGRLQFVDSKPSILDSGGFKDMDLFVSAKPGADVRVYSGKFEEFNVWTDAKEVGGLRQETATRIAIVGMDGKVKTPDFEP